MLKSVFGQDQLSPPLAVNPLSNNEILKTEEFSVQAGSAHDLEMQRAEQHGQEVYDGSSFVSYTDSVAWFDVDWVRNDEAEQDTSSIRDPQPSSFANDEAHLIRPPPAVFLPA